MLPSNVPVETEPSPRQRIVLAAYRLLADGGRDAVSTRAVTAAAGVQAPTIYRQFGDMRGLLAEVANYGFDSYLTSKHATPSSPDPVADLSRGWDMHVAFGLAEPAVYALMYGDPRPGPRPTAVGQARQMLRAIVQRIAEAGRLQITVDQAVDMVDAAGAGVVLHLLELPPHDRDTALSAAVRDAVLTAIVTGIDRTATTGRTRAPDHSDRSALKASRGAGLLATRAVSLKAVLDTADGRLSAGEMHLMNELLDRLSGPTQGVT